MSIKEIPWKRDMWTAVPSDSVISIMENVNRKIKEIRQQLGAGKDYESLLDISCSVHIYMYHKHEYICL